MFLLKKFLGEKYEYINKIIESYNDVQNGYINLEACCSYPFESVLHAQKFPMFTLPTEGMVGKRYFPSFKSMDDIDRYTEDLVLKLLDLKRDSYKVCNQPHSGTQANQIVYNAILDDYDTVLSLDPKSGGHISHNKFNKNINVINYHLSEDNLLDYTQIDYLTHKHLPKLIIIGASSYPNDINYKQISEIAHRHGSYVLVDACHTILYIMGKQYTNPFPEADFVTFSLEKVLRGPQGGIIVYRTKFYNQISYSVFPLTQGGPLQSMQFAKLLCFVELDSIDLQQYASAVQHNAYILGETLKANNIEIFCKDYRTHIILINVQPFGMSGREFEEEFYKHKILVNKNQIPCDTQSAINPSGIRFGTTCITNLSYKEQDVKILAQNIANILNREEVDNDKISSLITKYHQNINISS